MGTLILCVVQGYLLATSFENPSKIPIFSGIDQVIQRLGPLVPEPGLAFRVITVITLTAGTMLLMWIGEQVTEKGIGNGISLIITIGIVARLPAALVAGWQVFVPPAGSGREPISPFILFLLLAFLFIVIGSTIALTQALRKVSVQYAKQVRGNRVYGGQTSFLPLKVNYAGVMPIIFANAILLFPASILGFLFPGSPMANRIAAALATGQNVAWVLLFSVAVPFLFWCAMIGFVVYVHHTHVKVSWHDDRSAWAKAQPFVSTTVHLTFPFNIGSLMHHIMEHTAHHVDMSIPLYRLKQAQAKLENLLPGRIIVQRFSWRWYFQTARSCKLYDFTRQCWTDYKGRATSQPVLIPA